MGCSGVCDFWGTWDATIMECDEHCKWIEEDRSKTNDETVRKISKLLSDAKVRTVDKLVGKPIEVTMEGNLLKGWRILTEVL